MKIANRGFTATKYIKSKDGANHHIVCMECSSRQKFDRQTLVEAKKNVSDAGWREGVNEDKEAVCLCPECVEENQIIESTKNELELNNYDE